MTTVRQSSRTIVRILIGAGLAFGAAFPALAQADGNPRLDPTNGISGTMYAFVAKGGTRSLTSLKQNEPLGTATGTILVYQDAASGDLDADFTIDTQDGAHADLTCTGVVGRGTFALQCAGFDDDGDPINLSMIGKALMTKAGTVVLRKTAGIGFSDERTVSFVLAADPV